MCKGQINRQVKKLNPGTPKENKNMLYYKYA